MKRTLFLLMALIVNSLMGATLALPLGFSPAAGAVVLNAVALAVGNLAPGALRAGVYTEVWTGELIRKLRAGLEATFLDGIPDASSLVDNDVIHLVDAGVDPDVLINNTTYPIELQDLDDADKTISLDKFQTKVTPITDDELHAISYDKMSRVIESHGNAIKDAKFTKAAHALCSANAELVTTGDVDETTGRHRMIPKDVISLKHKLDLLKVPAVGRRLVLCPDHVNDLLGSSQSFHEQYNIDRANGTVGRLYGFDIYEYANNPIYTTAGAKKAVGAAASTGEFQCSFAFYAPRVFKATGSTKMYYSRAENDPEFQRNKVNFRHYFIVLPKKTDAQVTIRSGYTAS